MICIAVVEDEKNTRDMLVSYLNQYGEDRSLEFRIETFNDGAEIANGYSPKYDIILMDIQMESMDGMTAAEHIRKIDADVTIIFITQTAQYAIRGYSVGALDYLIKPVNFYAFSQRMDRAIEQIAKSKSHYIVVKSFGGMMKLDVDRIRYVESQGHTMVFHLDDGDLETSGTLKDMEKELSGYGFSRCNKGYLINLSKVDGIRAGAAIIGDDSLIISRGRKKEFLEDLSEYIGGHTK